MGSTSTEADEVMATILSACAHGGRGIAVSGRRPRYRRWCRMARCSGGTYGDFDTLVGQDQGGVSSSKLSSVRLS